MHLRRQSAAGQPESVGLFVLCPRRVLPDRQHRQWAFPHPLFYDTAGFSRVTNRHAAAHRDRMPRRICQQPMPGKRKLEIWPHLFPTVTSATLNGTPIPFGDWFWDANYDFYDSGSYFTNVKPIVAGAAFELTVTYRTLDSGLGPWQRPPRGCDTGAIAGTLTEDLGAVVYCVDEEPPFSLWGWTSSTPRDVYIPAP